MNMDDCGKRTVAGVSASSVGKVPANALVGRDLPRMEIVAVKVHKRSRALAEPAAPVGVIPGRTPT